MHQAKRNQSSTQAFLPILDFRRGDSNQFTDLFRLQRIKFENGVDHLE
jgi:hypothetical protein